ncbi:MAG: hypothetical protein LBB89_13295 [Treponema sp.]|jgi:hypothetical protein|nr:hypothetical protein [Treponema sp.]
MKNKSKVPLVRLFGIIALVAVMGFSMTACGGDDDGGGGGSGGKFTLTGIPAKYNGKYALLDGVVYSDNLGLFGCQSYTAQTNTLSPISNGKVSLPMWKVDESGNVEKYSGNDTADGVHIPIFDNKILSSTSPDAIVEIVFANVTFKKGSATRSWDQGTVSP